MIYLNTEFSRLKPIDLQNQSSQLEVFKQQFLNRDQGFCDVLDDELLFNQINDFTKNIPTHFKHFVLLGVGGSSLGFKTLLQAFAHLPKAESFHILDNVDPEKIHRVQSKIELEKTLFLVITKSGKTPETMGQYCYFKNQLLNKKIDQSKHFVFVTDENSLLDKLGQKENIPTFHIPQNVGGRFSVLTAVGLLPAAILGLDIKKIIEGAKVSRTQFLSNNTPQNTPFQIASIQHHYFEKNISQNIFFPYSESLKLMGEWFVQLIAESTGKINKLGENVGITPICSVGARDQHSILQLFTEGPKDKLFCFLKVRNFRQDLQIHIPKDLPFDFLDNCSFGKLLNAELEGTQKSITESGSPHFTIEIDQIDEASLGGLFFLFQGATAFLGEFLEIDAFNQPGVERSKILAKAILSE